MPSISEKNHLQSLALTITENHLTLSIQWARSVKMSSPNIGSYDFRASSVYMWFTILLKMQKPNTTINVWYFLLQNKVIKVLITEAQAPEAEPLTVGCVYMF